MRVYAYARLDSIGTGSFTKVKDLCSSEDRLYIFKREKRKNRFLKISLCGLRGIIGG